MRLPSRATAISVICGALALSVGSANAGAPKATRLLSVETTRGGIVTASITEGGLPLRVTLALVRSPRTFRAGSRCAMKSTDFAIAQAAERLDLATSVAVVSGSSTGALSVYLSPGGRLFTARRSLNRTIVLAGLARTSNESELGRSTLLQAENVAKKRHVGIWSRCRNPRTRHSASSARRLKVAVSVDRVLRLLLPAVGATVLALERVSLHQQ
jgi:hypothetical protein